MFEELHKCSNCETHYDNAFKFCPECGQNKEDDLTLGVLFYNTISNYFSFDARFFRSFLPLMTKPGFLPKKFIEGKRLFYIHPAQVYLFVSVVFFFIFSFYIRDSRSSIDKAMKDDVVLNPKIGKEKLNQILASDSVDVDSVIQQMRENMNPQDSAVITSITNELKGVNFQNDSLQEKEKDNKQWQMNFGFDEDKVDSLLAIGASDAEVYKAMGMAENAGFFKRKAYTQALKLYKERGVGAIWQTFFDSVPIAMFFLLPIFALLLKVFYSRKGRYAHHLVFSFYFFSFLFAVMALVLGINRFFDIPDWLDFLLIMSTYFYLLIAIRKFYKQGWILSFIKSSVVSFLFLSFIIPLAVIVVGLYSFMYY